MLHARDSFTKHVESVLQPLGIQLAVNPRGALQPNSCNLLYMNDVPRVTMNPAEYELITSLDVMAEGDTGAMADRKALQLAMAVNGAISGGWIQKKNWSNPAAPVDLKTHVWWRPWYGWRRVSEPDERLAHLNRTLSLFYVGERL